MSFLKYKNAFIESAVLRGFDNDYIQHCLAYAEKLYNKRLPIIYDQDHFSLLVGYSTDYLWRASNASVLFYRMFPIEKKGGGERIIHEPLPSLKEIQRWILDNILNNCPVNKFAKGFLKNTSIKDNARFHRNQSVVLKIDVRDFFDSIGKPRIIVFFKKLGYSQSISVLLANLCTLENSLPQGAPTSPALSNLVCKYVDIRLSRFTRKNRIRYTRYADDLTFSGNFKPGPVINLVRKVLVEEQLLINDKKTKVMRPHNRQIVTGVIVNKKMQAPKETRQTLRRDIYYIEKYGLESHTQQIGEKRLNYLRHLLGKANFILFLNPKDQNAMHARTVLGAYLMKK